MSKETSIDTSLINELAKLLTKTDLTEIEVEKGNNMQEMQDETALHDG